MKDAVSLDAILVPILQSPEALALGSFSSTSHDPLNPGISMSENVNSPLTIRSSRKPSTPRYGYVLERKGVHVVRVIVRKDGVLHLMQLHGGEFEIVSGTLLSE